MPYLRLDERRCPDRRHCHEPPRPGQRQVLLGSARRGCNRMPGRRAAPAAITFAKPASTNDNIPTRFFTRYVPVSRAND